MRHGATSFDRLAISLALQRAGIRSWRRVRYPHPLGRNPRRLSHCARHAMLESLPIGVLHFPGTGIQDNLADKARKLGIPVWKFGKGGA